MKLAGRCASQILILSLVVFLTACSPGTLMPTSTPTRTRAALLTPYHTSTLTATLAPSTRKPTLTPAPLPTATPFTHTIKKDETLLGIAFQYGVKLEDLMAANPGINVRFLSIGNVIIIPLNGDLATPAPTPAPPPLQVSEPVCYFSADSVLQCLAVVTNPLEEAYQNLTLRFTLYTRDGKLVAEQFVIPPLDRLLPGSSLPLLASFSGLLNGASKPDNYSVQATLLSAMVVPSGDEEIVPGGYVELAVEDFSTQISENGQAAQVTGQVVLPQDASSLWFVAVAYDHNQQPVGLRRLELDDICPTQEKSTPDAGTSIAEPTPCGPLPFELIVYSLGPVIERVEVFSEARR